MSDEDRRLFEAAVGALDEASRSKIARLKVGKSAGTGSVRGRTARLDKRLRDVSPVSTIDLHGLSRSEAVSALQRFLTDFRGIGTVLVVHGKGRGLLRERTRRALDEHPRVAEHLEAPRRLGGSGARLVRLRS